MVIYQSVWWHVSISTTSTGAALGISLYPRLLKQSYQDGAYLAAKAAAVGGGGGC